LIRSLRTVNQSMSPFLSKAFRRSGERVETSSKAASTMDSSPERMPIEASVVTASMLFGSEVMLESESAIRFSCFRFDPDWMRRSKGSKKNSRLEQRTPRSLLFVLPTHAPERFRQQDLDRTFHPAHRLARQLVQRTLEHAQAFVHLPEPEVRQPTPQLGVHPQPSTPRSLVRIINQTQCSSKRFKRRLIVPDGKLEPPEVRLCDRELRLCLRVFGELVCGLEDRDASGDLGDGEVVLAETFGDEGVEMESGRVGRALLAESLEGEGGTVEEGGRGRGGGGEEVVGRLSVEEIGFELKNITQTESSQFCLMCGGKNDCAYQGIVGQADSVLEEETRVVLVTAEGSDDALAEPGE
jgi:hypothetical protein